MPAADHIKVDQVFFSYDSMASWIVRLVNVSKGLIIIERIGSWPIEKKEVQADEFGKALLSGGVKQITAGMNCRMVNWKRVLNY